MFRLSIACLAGIWMFVVAAPAVAQGITTIATIATAGVVGSKLISQFEETANRTLQAAGQQGDIMESKLGDELRVATANLNLALGDQRDKTFEQLTPSLRQGFDSLNLIIKSINDASGKAVSVAQAANLDLIEFTNRLPFTTKVDYYLSSVRGLTQSYAEGDYKINFLGLGFGFSPQNRIYSVKISIADVDIPASQFQQLSDKETAITVSDSIFEGMFQDDKTVVKPMRITVAITKQVTDWVFFHSEHTDTYVTDLSLILLPKYPGVLTGTESLKKLELDPAVLTKDIVHHTIDCHTDRPCDWTQELDLAADEYAVGVRYDCSGQCGWDYSKRGGGYAVDYSISSEGHTVIVYRHNDGEHETTVTHHIDYRKMKPQFSDSAVKPVRIAFDRPFSIDMSSDNSNCGYALTAQLVTKPT